MKKIFSLVVLFALAITLVSCEEEKPPEEIKSITFPAYSVENPDGNAKIEAVNNTPKFKITIDNLPSGCEIKHSKGDEVIPPGDFYSQVYIYSDKTLIGYVGFNTFEPDTTGVPQEEYYKTVYPNLRLSSTFNWAGYKAVKTTDNEETATVSIRYIEPKDIEKFAGKLPDAPVSESFGILSYNKELGVCVGVALMPTTLTKNLVNKIAESITITAA